MNLKPISFRYAAFAAIVMSMLFGTAYAQQTPPTRRIPGTGELLQQVPRQPEQEPRGNLDLRMLKTPRQPPSSSQKFQVRSINITGNSLLPAKTLRGIVAGSEGRKLSLKDLYELANRIGNAYHEAGYPLTRAYVPAQTVKNGMVTIAVVEARYGKITLNNKSDVTDATLDATLAPLKPTHPVMNSTLERSLLLLSNIPGARVSSVIRPGDKPGTSNLVVDVVDAPRYTGAVGIDNFGNHYTGRDRLSGNFNINGLLHRGDLLDFSALSSGEGMNYLRGGYRMLLNGRGTTLRVGASWLHYRLSHGFDHKGGLEKLGAHGSALGASLVLSHPFIRSTAANLYGRIEFDHRRLKDEIDSVSIHNNRHLDNVSIEVAGDERDEYGVTNYSLSGTRGKLAFNNQRAQLVDRLTVRTEGYFSRLRASVSRLQRLSPHDAIYAGYTIQWANKNLDNSEQLFLGGPNTVRGYDTGALAGSQGHMVNAAYRHDFAFSGVPGRWEVSVFADTGRVQVYKHASPGTVNNARISSAGVGLRWSGPGGWRVSASVAKPIGATPDMLEGTSTGTRIWVRLRKGFY